ncbi:MAG: hypothetical protein D6702_02315 [Planctomycetota bacterium]|nr:MAG: hypothetical protein D6702_02315 [Planctomycetota bacterium]
MAVQPDRPNTSGLLIIAVTGAILTVVVAYIAAASWAVVKSRQAEAKALSRDLSERDELRAAQEQRLAGIEQAMAEVVAQRR